MYWLLKTFTSAQHVKDTLSRTTAYYKNYIVVFGGSGGKYVCKDGCLSRIENRTIRLKFSPDPPY